MQFRYSFPRKSLSSSAKQLAIIASLAIVPVTFTWEKIANAKPLQSSKPAQQPLTSPPQGGAVSTDPRILRLKKFLSHLHCPVSNLSEEFVHAADDNQLDWRLLPSISVIESGGGKAFRNNNIFGWNNGAQLFPTIRAGLHEVAFKLGKSPLYRHRDVRGKLKVYNPDDSYAASVLQVMNRISPVANLTPVSRLVRRQADFVYATD